MPLFLVKEVVQAPTTALASLLEPGIQRFVIIVRVLCVLAEQLDGILWPETSAGQTYTANCPVGQSGQKTRLCSASGQWEAPTGVCSKCTKWM